LNPPGGVLAPSGATNWSPSIARSTEAALSTMSCWHLSPTQEPVNRDIAMPARPKVTRSAMFAGLSTGIKKSTIVYSE
jgi:hypothetical protein